MRRWIGIVCLVLLTGCGGGDTDQTVDVVTLVLENEVGESFTARLEGPRAWLFMPEGTLDLPRVEAASGVKFSDGVTTFWSMGQEAMLSRGDEPPVTYLNRPAKAVWEHAKLNGVDFRAVGNEPGWVLELRHDTIVLFMNYNADRFEFPTPAAVTDGDAGRTVYTTRHDGHALELELSPGPCQDTMADASYETAVRVVLDGTEFRGCGRALH